mgnify:CR=1 FL=1
MFAPRSKMTANYIRAARNISEGTSEAHEGQEGQMPYVEPAIRGNAQGLETNWQIGEGGDDESASLSALGLKRDDGTWHNFFGSTTEMLHVVCQREVTAPVDNFATPQAIRDIKYSATSEIGRAHV